MIDRHFEINRRCWDKMRRAHVQKLLGQVVSLKMVMRFLSTRSQVINRSTGVQMCKGFIFAVTPPMGLA